MTGAGCYIHRNKHSCFKCYRINRIIENNYQNLWNKLMAKLNIPREGYIGLGHLANLEPQVFERALKALREAGPTVYHMNVLADALVAATGLPADEAFSIVQAVSGMSLLFSRSSIDVAKFASRVTESLDDSDEESGVTFDDDDKNRLKTYLPSILESENIVISAVALDTLMDVERPLAEALALVDLRPIFAVSGSASISAFAVTTSLKLSWFDLNGAQETYFTLDDADIDSAIKALENAKRQAQALREFVENSGSKVVRMGDRK